jgi:hypothetical protein
MAFFDPSRPMILRIEASFNEGLSAALPQTTNRGIKLVASTNLQVNKERPKQIFATYRTEEQRAKQTTIHL